MNKSEIIERITNGEDSYTQFKAQIIPAKELAKEFVALLNAEGGIVVFGISDNGDIKGLSADDVESLGQLVGNVANENVKPPTHPLTQNLTITGKKITIVTIPKGTNRPHSTSSGDYYIKSGPDKKKMSQEQLRRLFAESSLLFADEDIIPQSDINHLNNDKFKRFLKQDNPLVFIKLTNKELDLKTVLTNLNLLKNNHLTLAGNLLFGENPQRFSPSFYVDCCYFDGNDVSATKFISKQSMKGTFKEIYEDSYRFVISQLRNYQVEEGFNSNGELEIHTEVLTELIVNALVHRDYYINSSIKIFMFHNRVEIISPGKLINSLTVEKIKNGIAIHRNPILSSICKTLLPYTGYGSGIKRVLKLNPDVKFINDIDMEQFKSIVYREKLGENLNKLGENSNKLGENPDKLGEKQNIKLSKNKKLILNLMKQNPKTTINLLSGEVGISTTSIENSIKILKEKNIIIRIGSDKGGQWKVKDGI